MRHTVLLVPADRDWIAAAVPAMPGCFSQGRTRDAALANIRDAMMGWLEVESEHGRDPLRETPELITNAVADALHRLDMIRENGELLPAASYDLELVSVTLPPVPAAS